MSLEPMSASEVARHVSSFEKAASDIIQNSRGNIGTGQRSSLICFYCMTCVIPPSLFPKAGRLQQKVSEMEETQRDIITEYEEQVQHLKAEVSA